MSWSIEEHIGECRPFPAQVVVYKGETDECLAYVSGEVADKLQAENAKLRELVEDMLDCIEIRAAFGRPPTDGMCEGFVRRARELGIEVDG